MAARNTRALSKAPEREAELTIDFEGIIGSLDLPRNTKLTPALAERLYVALEQNPRTLAACKKVRISMHAFYQWQRRYPEFKALMDEARYSGFGAVEDALIGRATRNDTTAAIFLLKSWRRERYGEQPKHNINVNVNSEQAYDLSRLTPEEIDTLEALSRKMLPTGPESDE